MVSSSDSEYNFKLTAFHILCTFKKIYKDRSVYEDHFPSHIAL